MPPGKALPLSEETTDVESPASTATRVLPSYEEATDVQLRATPTMLTVHCNAPAVLRVAVWMSPPFTTATTRLPSAEEATARQLRLPAASCLAQVMPPSLEV